MKNIVIFLLLCTFVINVVCISASFNTYQDYQKAHSHNFSMSDVKKDTMSMACSIVQAMAYILVFICFCSWLYKSHEDLDNLGVQELKYRHSQAFSGFLIPISNIFRPYFFTQELYKGSCSENNDWQKNSSSVVIKLWWFLVSGFLFSYVGGINIALNEDIHAYQNTTLLLLLADGLVAISAILAIFVMKSIEKEQDKKYELLQNKKNA